VSDPLSEQEAKVSLAHLAPYRGGTRSGRQATSSVRAQAIGVSARA